MHQAQCDETIGLFDLARTFCTGAGAVSTRVSAARHSYCTCHHKKKQRNAAGLLPCALHARPLHDLICRCGWNCTDEEINEMVQSARDAIVEWNISYTGKNIPQESICNSPKNNYVQVQLSSIWKNIQCLGKCQPEFSAKNCKSHRKKMYAVLLTVMGSI